MCGRIVGVRRDEEAMRLGEQAVQHVHSSLQFIENSRLLLAEGDE